MNYGVWENVLFVYMKDLKYVILMIDDRLLLFKVVGVLLSVCSYWIFNVMKILMKWSLINDFVILVRILICYKRLENEF